MIIYSAFVMLQVHLCTSSIKFLSPLLATLLLCISMTSLFITGLFLSIWNTFNKSYRFYVAINYTLIWRNESFFKPVYCSLVSSLAIMAFRPIPVRSKLFVIGSHLKMYMMYVVFMALQHFYQCFILRFNSVDAWDRHHSQAREPSCWIF